MSEPAYEATLRQRFGEGSFTTAQFRDNRRVLVKPAQVYAFLECLKNACGFDMLAELTAVDYLHYPDARDRFGVVYVLLNTGTGERVIVKTHLNEPDFSSGLVWATTFLVYGLCALAVFGASKFLPKPIEQDEEPAPVRRRVAAAV